MEIYILPNTIRTYWEIFLPAKRRNKRDIIFRIFCLYWVGNYMNLTPT